MAEPRKGGLGDFGRQRIRDNIGNKKNQVAGLPVTEYEKQQHGTDRAAEVPTTTPWEFPGSSRVHAYQYDSESMQLRVRFVKYGTPWIYEGVPLAVFQSFDASPSKGRYINSTLNHFNYREATMVEAIEHFGDV